MDNDEEGEMSVDDLACVLSYSVNISKCEYDKLVERHESISKSLHSGVDLISEYENSVEANREYLRLIVFNEENADEKYIRENLEMSIHKAAGVVRSLQSSIRAYNRIFKIVKG